MFVYQEFKAFVAAKAVTGETYDYAQPFTCAIAQYVKHKFGLRTEIVLVSPLCGSCDVTIHRGDATEIFPYPGVIDIIVMGQRAGGGPTTWAELYNRLLLLDELASAGFVDGSALVSHSQKEPA